MVIDNLFWIGLLLVVGYLDGMASDRFRLPKIIGYIATGSILRFFLLHLLPRFALKRFLLPPYEKADCVLEKAFRATLYLSRLQGGFCVH